MCLNLPAPFNRKKGLWHFLHWMVQAQWYVLNCVPLLFPSRILICKHWCATSWSKLQGQQLRNMLSMDILMYVGFFWSDWDMNKFACVCWILFCAVIKRSVKLKSHLHLEFTVKILQCSELLIRKSKGEKLHENNGYSELSDTRIKGKNLYERLLLQWTFRKQKQKCALKTTYLSICMLPLTKDHPHFQTTFAVVS